MQVFVTWLGNAIGTLISTVFSARFAQFFGGISLLSCFIIWLAIDIVNSFYTSKDDNENE